MANKRVKTSGAGAVMANRVVGPVEGDTDLMALHRRLDFFPTPLWAGRAGAEALQRLDPFCRVVKDPACGEGHLVAAAEDYFEAQGSDVYPHTPTITVRDWLDDAAWDEDRPEADWVFTNPPFSLAHEFVRRGLRRARRGVALLLRLAFLEGVERHGLLAGDNPLTLLATFSERVPMTIGRWDVSATSATAYAWFYWMKEATPQAPIWLPPGTRQRLWKPDDAERFGWREPLPLFDREAAGFPQAEAAGQ